MIKILWKVISPLISLWGIKINPTTLEWVEHYIQGSQSPKTLPSSLIPYTKRHLCLDLDEYFCGSTLRGVARCYDEEGYLGTDWFRHPTAGVVGGFSYELISWEDKFIFSCRDRWDFNPCTEKGEDYIVPLPEGADVTTLRKVLKRFGVPISKGEKEIGISEAWLCRFNDSHAFDTYWMVEVEEPLSCPICIDTSVSINTILNNLAVEGFGYLSEQVSVAYNSPYAKTRILLERGASLWFHDKKCQGASIVCNTMELYEKYRDLTWCFCDED